MKLGILSPVSRPSMRANRNGQTHEVNMSINIGKYHAEGPFGNENNLQPQSGVYVILGRGNGTANWNVVDIGESENIRERVANHDRAPCWRGQGHAQLSVAAIYADARSRMLIERQLRAQFNPPCGLI
jgi:hypothetical protein